MPGLYVKLGRGTPQPGKVYRLTGRTFLVGRSDQADIQLWSDVASREHAVLRIEGERWFVVDLGSRNGTYLNGRRVNNAALRPMDRLKFGPGGPKVGIVALDPSPPMEEDSREVLPGEADTGVKGVPVREETTGDFAGSAARGHARAPEPPPAAPPARSPTPRPGAAPRAAPAAPPAAVRSRRTSDVVLLSLGVLAVVFVLALWILRPKPEGPDRVKPPPAPGPVVPAEPSTSLEPRPAVPDRPRNVVVPALYGLDREQAEARLREKGLRGSFVAGREAGPFETPGRVQAQEPAAGEVVLQGTVVTVRLCQ